MGNFTKIAVLAALTCSTAATAQGIGEGMDNLMPCRDWGGDALAMIAIGPNNEGIRHFYEGMVTVIALDSSEPAAASAGVAILMPSGNGEDEPAFRTCWMNHGFTNVDVDGATATYDPAEGLTLSIPTMRYDDMAGGGVAGEPLRLLINGGQGTIRILD